MDGKGCDGQGGSGEGEGGAGKCSRHIIRYLLKNLGDEFEGRIMLKCIPTIIFKNLKCSINNNSL
jgi:hypothetical protein